MTQNNTNRSHENNANCSPRKNPCYPYINKTHATIANFAELFKVALQMIIGFIIVGFVILKAILILFPGNTESCQAFFHWLCVTHVLVFVSGALAFSAAIELGYMLFTPGPDEALDPLILGLAAAVLSIAAQADGYVRNSEKLLFISLSLGTLVTGIGILFYVRKNYHRNPAETRQPPEEKAESSSSQVPERLARADSGQGCFFILLSLFRKNRGK